MTVMVIQWCKRCSGWRYRRLSVDAVSYLGVSSSVQAAETHFLPGDSTDLEDLTHLMSRAILASQEIEEDRHDYLAYLDELPFD